MEVFVGSEPAGDYFNIKNLGVLFDCMSCLFLGVVLIERLCGLFVVVVSVIDFTID